jgi:hypothetical protein
MESAVYSKVGAAGVQLSDPICTLLVGYFTVRSSTHDVVFVAIWKKKKTYCSQFSKQGYLG